MHHTQEVVPVACMEAAEFVFSSLYVPAAFPTHHSFAAEAIRCSTKESSPWLPKETSPVHVTRSLPGGVSQVGGRIPGFAVSGPLEAGAKPRKSRAARAVCSGSSQKGQRIPGIASLDLENLIEFNFCRHD